LFGIRDTPGGELMYPTKRASEVFLFLSLTKIFKSTML